VIEYAVKFVGSPMIVNQIAQTIHDERRIHQVTQPLYTEERMSGALVGKREGYELRFRAVWSVHGLACR